MLLPLPLHSRSGATALEVKRRGRGVVPIPGLRENLENAFCCFRVVVRGIHTSQENSQPPRRAFLKHKVADCRLNRLYERLESQTTGTSGLENL